MVHTDSLDFETADDDQVDLFFLVDCVLDEIELAKQAAAAAAKGPEPEVNGEIMPEASEEFCTADLMDHFEGVPHYSDSDQSYASPDTSSYISNTSSFHHGDSFTSLPPELAVELLQNDIESDCLSYVARQDIPNEIPVTSSHNDPINPMEQFTVPHEDNISRNNYTIPPVPQFYSYEQSVDHCDKVPVSNAHKDSSTCTKESDLSNIMDKNGFNFDKELPKAFADLQQYTDLIQTHDLGQRTAAVTSTSPSLPTMSSTSSSQSVHFYSEDSNDTTTSEFVSWTCKHPENWSTNEVLDWLYYSAERNGVDCSLLRGESFSTVTGSNLCEMGPDEFCRLEPNYGQFLYKLFRQLVNGLRFTLPQETRVSFQDQPDLDTYYTEPNAHAYYDPARTSYDHSSQSQYIAKPLFHDQSQSQSSQYHQQSTYDYGSSHVPMSCPNGPESSALNPYDYPREVTEPQQYDQIYQYGLMVSRDQTRLPQSRVSTIRAKYEDGVTPRRRPGRPRIKSLPTEEELAAQREKKLKSQHLWEFIYELLNKSIYNPSVLKWENQSEGVFRFVQSETVAQLWGTLKSNENMTYEKLSRAMRHYYKRGILERVEGRRLVYKFSRVTLDKMKEKLAARRELER